MEALLVRAEPTDGQIYLRLHGAGAARLRGDGECTFRWGPRGPVELTRR